MGCRRLISAALVALTCLTAPAFAQQQAGSAAVVDAAYSPERVKQELEKLKKGRTLTIFPAAASDDSSGTTMLRIENSSAFNMIILVVGPTTERLLLEPEHVRMMTVEPGDYEIAFTVVGRDVPPFYGKQTIAPNMQFRHKFSVPAV